MLGHLRCDRCLLSVVTCVLSLLTCLIEILLSVLCLVGRRWVVRTALTLVGLFSVRTQWLLCRLVRCGTNSVNFCVTSCLSRRIIRLVLLNLRTWLSWASSLPIARGLCKNSKLAKTIRVGISLSVPLIPRL